MLIDRLHGGRVRVAKRLLPFFFTLSIASLKLLIYFCEKLSDMTWEELEKIESYLKENGYRNGGKPYHCNADHYWYKAFGRDCNHYEEGRSLYQVFLNVYDWRKFWDRDPSLRKFNKAASITATIHVSRTVYEVGIRLDFDLKNDKFDLNDIEDKAFEFFKYVNENFGAPPKDEE